MRERNDCRLCGSEVETKLVLSPTPIANNFTKNPNEGEFYPLELVQCVKCKHVQNRHVIDNLYTDYKYQTPSANRPRLLETAKKLKERYPKAETVLEIGCNNCINVEELGKVFNKVVGVDPAGLFPAWPMAFNLNTAKMIEDRIGKIDLIVANNVFAHIDNLDEVFEGITYLSDNLVFEVQYFGEMVEKGIYDTIYHEHVDQHTIAPLEGFLCKYKLHVHEVERFGDHGGSIRVYCGRTWTQHYGEDPVDWDAYKLRIHQNQQDFLKSLPDEFCLWGAPAKATTMIHQLGIKDRIKYCVDSTPCKQGLYLPGTGIKILPDFIDNSPKVLAAWNYKIGGEDVIRPYRFCA